MLRFEIFVEEGLGDDDTHPTKVGVWAVSEFYRRDPGFKRKHAELAAQRDQLRLKIMSYSPDLSKEIEEFGNNLLLEADNPYAIYSTKDQQKV